VKNSYRLFLRGDVYYVEHCETGRQQSLRTKDQQEAQRLCNARNDAANAPALNLALGRAYLSACDPQLATRTWADLMTRLQNEGRESSKARKVKAFRAAPFDMIRTLTLSATPADRVLAVANANASACHYARLLHAQALKLGWLAWPLVPSASWPRFSKGIRRGITEAEQRRILAVEQNPEWRNYLTLLWESGAAQSDGAILSAVNVDFENRVLFFQRKKLKADSEPVSLSIGPRLESLLKRLPAIGPFFPKISIKSAENRCGHFQQLCAVAGVKGVTLHSYRYSWAQRANALGYPERWARKNLGHKSVAAHYGYSKGARFACPPLETFEASVVVRIEAA